MGIKQNLIIQRKYDNIGAQRWEGGDQKREVARRGDGAPLV